MLLVHVISPRIVGSAWQSVPYVYQLPFSAASVGSAHSPVFSTVASSVPNAIGSGRWSSNGHATNLPWVIGTASSHFPFFIMGRFAYVHSKCAHLSAFSFSKGLDSIVVHIPFFSLHASYTVIYTWDIALATYSSFGPHLPGSSGTRPCHTQECLF